MRDNFVAFLTDGRKVVPGSVRQGHNIMTVAGRRWLSQVIAWSAISDTVADTPLNNKRVRWFGVGTGSHIVQPGIEALDVPAAVNGTPDYIKLASVAPVYPHTSRPVRSSVVFTCSFAAAELPGDPTISEAGLFVDLNDTAGDYGITNTAMPATTQFGEPIAYKVFYPGLTKTTGVHILNLRWELVF
jgi:hypothetical protein